MTDPKEAWTSGDGSVLPEGTVAWVLVDGAVLEAPLLWAGGRWYAHDVEGHAFDRPNPVKAYMVLTPPAPPAVRGPLKPGDPVPPCACGTVEAWHNPGCVLYPEGGYPADQPWRGPPKPAPEPDRYDSAGDKRSTVGYVLTDEEAQKILDEID